MCVRGLDGGEKREFCLEKSVGEKKEVEQTWQTRGLWKERGNSFRSSSASSLGGMNGKCQQAGAGTHMHTTMHRTGDWRWWDRREGAVRSQKVYVTQDIRDKSLEAL